MRDNRELGPKCVLDVDQRCEPNRDQMKVEDIPPQGNLKPEVPH